MIVQYSDSESEFSLRRRSESGYSQDGSIISLENNIINNKINENFGNTKSLRNMDEENLLKYKNKLEELFFKCDREIAKINKILKRNNREVENAMDDQALFNEMRISRNGSRRIRAACKNVKVEDSKVKFKKSSSSQSDNNNSVDPKMYSMKSSLLDEIKKTFKPMNYDKLSNAEEEPVKSINMNENVTNKKEYESEQRMIIQKHEGERKKGKCKNPVSNKNEKDPVQSTNIRKRSVSPSYYIRSKSILRNTNAERQPINYGITNKSYDEKYKPNFRTSRNNLIETQVHNTIESLSRHSGPAPLFFINSLQKTKYKPFLLQKNLRRNSDKYREEICFLCKNVFVEGVSIKTLGCSDKFHAACIDEWLMEENECPNCCRSILL